MPLPESVPHSLRISARELVYRTLVNWIIDGTLAPGEKIPTDQIQEILGVSRTPIREALQLAEQDRLVTISPGRESIVAQASPDSWPDIVGPIAALERLAASRVAGLISEKAIAKLEEINREMEAAVDAGDISATDELDAVFHQIIVDEGKNPFLDDLLRRLNLHRRWYVRQFFPEFSPGKESCVQHAEIIARLKEGDSDGAASAMARNWERSPIVKK
jgi:DNA-binding GntR family transcriptional regulator